MMSRRGLGMGRQETLEVEQDQEVMICTKCGQNIVGKALKVITAHTSNSLFKPLTVTVYIHCQAGDTYWHEAHFTCSECGLRLRDSKVFQKDGLLYCEMDYKKRFVPRCAACSGFILSVGGPGQETLI